MQLIRDNEYLISIHMEGHPCPTYLNIQLLDNTMQYNIKAITVHYDKYEID